MKSELKLYLFYIVSTIIQNNLVISSKNIEQHRHMAQSGNVLLLVVHPWFMQNNNLEVLLLIGAFENMSYVVFTLKVTGTNASVHWKKNGSNSVGLVKAI